MTCHWCKHYRRRRLFKDVCVHPEKDFKIVKMKSGEKCKYFDPRQTCTTCALRCSPEDKACNVASDGSCSMWKLRVLGKHGGCRLSKWAEKHGLKEKNKDETKKYVPNPERVKEKLWCKFDLHRERNLLRGQLSFVPRDLMPKDPHNRGKLFSVVDSMRDMRVCANGGYADAQQDQLKPEDGGEVPLRGDGVLPEVRGVPGVRAGCEEAGYAFEEPIRIPRDDVDLG